MKNTYIKLFILKLFVTADAIRLGYIISGSISLLYRISAPSMAPPIGALNIVPIPAPIPTATALLLSSGFKCNNSAIIDPSPDDI